MVVVEDAVEAADPEPGIEELLVAGGVVAGEPRAGAEGEPGEERGERRPEEDGLGLGEAADDVEGEDGGQEVEALVPRRAHRPHLPVAEPAAAPAAARQRRAAAAAVAAAAAGAEVVPGVAGAEGGVVGEHVRRRARHGPRKKRLSAAGEARPAAAGAMVEDGSTNRRAGSIAVRNCLPNPIDHNAGRPVGGQPARPWLLRPPARARSQEKRRGKEL